nr:hypothetical protein [Saprospiraceae bacterium]
MKAIGLIFLILGLIGTFIFGPQALQSSEIYNFLGFYLGMSTSNLTPVIVSVVLLIIGGAITIKTLNQAEQVSTS